MGFTFMSARLCQCVKVSHHLLLLLPKGRRVRDKCSFPAVKTNQSLGFTPFVHVSACLSPDKDEYFYKKKVKLV